MFTEYQTILSEYLADEKPRELIQTINRINSNDEMNYVLLLAGTALALLLVFVS